MLRLVGIPFCTSKSPSVIFDAVSPARSEASFRRGTECRIYRRNSQTVPRWYMW